MSITALKVEGNIKRAELAQKCIEALIEQHLIDPANKEKAIEVLGASLAVPR
ncbi:MAG: hypothetical protein JST28_09045 [Acidobacteria bacterium]|nr:hypothetical protein [Acidobacteriota bacterium]